MDGSSDACRIALLLRGLRRRSKGFNASKVASKSVTVKMFDEAHDCTTFGYYYSSSELSSSGIRQRMILVRNRAGQSSSLPKVSGCKFRGVKSPRKRKYLSEGCTSNSYKSGYSGLTKLQSSPTSTDRTHSKCTGRPSSLFAFSLLRAPARYAFE